MGKPVYFFLCFIIKVTSSVLYVIACKIKNKTFCLLFKNMLSNQNVINYLKLKITELMYIGFLLQLEICLFSSMSNFISFLIFKM